MNNEEKFLSCFLYKADSPGLFYPLSSNFSKRKELLEEIFSFGQRDKLNRHFDFASCGRYYGVCLGSLYERHPEAVEIWAAAFDKVCQPKPLTDFL